MPAVVVGITDHKSRQQEKEINRQVAMVNEDVEVTRSQWFGKMESNYDDGGDTTQSVEDGIVWFGGKGLVGHARMERNKLGP